MLRIVKVAKGKNCYYPPTGKIGYPQGAGPPVVNPCSCSKEEQIKADFSRVEVASNFVPRRIRPEGARQSTAEANVLSKIQQIENCLGSQNGDILGR